MENMEKMIYTKDRQDKILYQGTFKGIDFVIYSFGTHPVAYVRIPENHKYYNTSHMNINDNSPAHGGFTYTGSLSHIVKNNPSIKSGFYYGWDYSHYDDFSGFDLMYPLELQSGGKKWTTEEIYKDVIEVIEWLVNIK